MLIFHGNTLCQGLLAATLGPRGKLAVHRVNAVGGREERGKDSVLYLQLPLGSTADFCPLGNFIPTPQGMSPEVKASVARRF